MIKISLAQFEVQVGKPEVNFHTAVKFIEHAAAQHSSIILLPELWTSGYDLSNWTAYISPNQNILGEIIQLSKKHQIAIGGSYITADEQGCRNTFIIAKSDGTLSTPYHKVHLFRLLEEHQFFQAGDRFVIEQFEWGKAGLAICYDLRFPEMFRFHAKNGASMVLIVAQWGARRAEHWRTFLKARAIENQIFVAGVNAIGRVGNTLNAGYSAVVSPWGEVLIEGAPDHEELLSAEIDFNLIKEVKQHLNSAQDRRDDLYKKWFDQSA